MGKGDKKTKKGKIWAGSYGVSRKKKQATTFVAKPKAKKAEPEMEDAEKKAPAKKAPAKKVAAKKTTTKKTAAKK